MSDISVSRNHSRLKLYNGSFYLEDNYSKYGTVALIQTDIVLHPKRQISIQANGAYLRFMMQKSCIGSIKCYENHILTKADLNEYLKFKKIK